ncbi:FeoB-associated Cys-rich membrane protein [Sinomicrobium soli]|nr:FeoB-associated Cys-rich membrane protein [Sinomicrobium sp. N-1-3-6]RAV29718.1 FeoB-associated Cys-rich membrane protein [Sinomicrobium sp. N-1-3-6]
MPDIQTTLVYIALGAAIGFLVKKFLLPSRRKNKSNCGGGPDCGCH